MLIADQNAPIPGSFAEKTLYTAAIAAIASSI
jgi:hypothetical protein